MVINKNVMMNQGIAALIVRIFLYGAKKNVTSTLFQISINTISQTRLVQHLHCKILRRMPQKHILVFQDPSKTQFSVSSSAKLTKGILAMISVPFIFLSVKCKDIAN